MTSRTQVHLDTDLGSDTDDLCALAFLLGAEAADLVGVTTSTDPAGRRAGLTAYALDLAGRSDVPLEAGAEGSLGGLMVPLAFPDHWPEPIPPRPSRPGAALELLEANAEAGATVIAVGPYTNLALLETSRPGLLGETRIFLMGGHVTTPREGLPRWGVHDDFNVQQDRIAASVVMERCDPFVVPLAACLEVHLRSSHLEGLRSSGPLPNLIADQAEMHARENGRTELGRSFPALPDDLLNFHYDPLACAAALDWDGIRFANVPTRLELTADRLWMRPHPEGRPLRCATEVDGPAFEELWLAAVRRIGGP